MKIFILIYIVLFFYTIALSQPQPTLLGKYTSQTEDPDALFHTLENTREKFEKDPNSFFAIRTCANVPLPIAFAKAKGVSWGANIIKKQLEFLKNLNTLNSKANIFFLKNDRGCQIPNESITEYWFVPSMADFPSFVEIKQYDDLTVHELIFNYEKVDGKLLSLSAAPSLDGTILNSELFEETQNKIAKILLAEKTAYIIIEVPTSKTAINRATNFKTLLNRNGIGNHRIFMQKGKNTVKKDLYPNITIIYQK